MKNEFFGNEDQIRLATRGQALWSLLRDKPDYSFYGRMVSLCAPTLENAVEVVSNLARLQGATSCQYYPADNADRFCELLDQQGLNSSRYEQFRGEIEALDLGREILEKHSFPDDLTLITLASDTPSELVSDVAELSLSCGVMPVPGQTMRGNGQPGICHALVDRDHKPVATASSYLCNHPESAKAKDAFWGMLATDPAWRGHGLGKIIGAHSIVTMWEQFGARSFSTGIKADNPASMGLCTKLGVTQSDWTFIGCSDPSAFSGSITR
ncbi:MAG: GNAT family N-acetyltransferase [Pseudomonadota bacterium]